MLPISSSLFRTNGSSPDFHKSVLSGSFPLESSKHPSSCLPRRLVCCKSKQTNVDRRSREDVQSSNKSRFHSKFGKSNLILTQTITYIGAMFCLKEGIVRPNSERITKFLLGIENILKKGKSSYIKRFSSPIRYYGFLHRTNTECKVVHAITSIAPSFSLETKSNSGNKSSFFETFKKSSKMVVEPGKCKQGQVHNHGTHR